MAKSVSDKLITAIRDGNTSEVETLLGDGHEPNDDNLDDAALTFAIQRYIGTLKNQVDQRSTYLNIITSLLKHKAEYPYPLHLIANKPACHNIGPLIDLFIAHGAEINAFDSKKKWTAVRFAISCLNFEVTKILVENGATVESDYYFCIVNYLSFMFDSQRAASIDILDLLKQHHPDVDARIINHAIFTHEQTPLMAAMSGSETNIARWFIDNGANVNATDTEGKTPLMYLASSRSIVCDDLFKLLKMKNADMDAVDHHGMTAWVHAALAKNEKLITLLQDNGVVPSVFSVVMNQVNRYQSIADKIAALTDLIAHLAELHPLLKPGLTNDLAKLEQQLYELNTEKLAQMTGARTLVQFVRGHLNPSTPAPTTASLDNRK